jgi:PAS domain S-box-containing protein
MPKEFGLKCIGPKSILNEDHYLQMDSTHQTKNGQSFPVTVFLKNYKPNKNDKYVMVLVELKNKTDIKTTLSEVSSEFVENSCDFYFDIDENGLGEYVSPEVTKLFGFTQEESIGKNYFSFLSKHSSGTAKDTFEHFSLNRQPFKISHECGKDAKGKIVHNQLFFTPKFSDSGKFAGYRVLGWVISKPKSDTK